MDFQASHIVNQQIYPLSCTIISSYSQGANTIYNITAVDGSGNNFTGIMQRSYRGEFIVSQLTPVTS